MKGKVKFFNNEKRFGFITCEDKDYFVHQSNVENDAALSENDEVTFEIEQGERGPKAVNVKKSE
jgi:cold shock protein